MIQAIQLNSASPVPLYRQLHSCLRDAIQRGDIRRGERLPPTRELAGQLGLNRATVSAAYELLEGEGLINGQVGRGSFVQAGVPGAAPAREDRLISFATSRPLADLFPLDEFRETASEVIADPRTPAILQLGSPGGYAPLRQYLMDEARRDGLAGPGDDILITSGCQQALDLLQRELAGGGQTVAVEDPVYTGLKNAFLRGGARLAAVPVDEGGLDLAELARMLPRERPAALVVSPDFQNPTGVSMGLDSRRELLRLARESGTVVIENGMYARLRYRGQAQLALKALDDTGSTVLLGSFSKIAFPGLRVGWVIGPRPLIARLTEAKQWCDLHTDHLSQAILLRFAGSGRLERHLARMLEAGVRGLDATLGALEQHMPQGTRWTRPEGGMNVWVTLPAGTNTTELAHEAERAGVSYLPGPVFAVARDASSSLRISFAGAPVDQIRSGIAILGGIFRRAAERAAVREPALALV